MEWSSECHLSMLMCKQTNTVSWQQVRATAMKDLPICPYFMSVFISGIGMQYIDNINNCLTALKYLIYYLLQSFIAGKNNKVVNNRIVNSENTSLKLLVTSNVFSRTDIIIERRSVVICHPCLRKQFLSSTSQSIWPSK